MTINTDPDRPGRPDLLDVVTESLSDAPVDALVTRQHVADLAAYLTGRLIAAFDTVVAQPGLDQPLATGGTITSPPVLTAERGPEVHVTDLPEPSGRVFVGPGGQLDLANAFTYHPPKPDQVERYTALRAHGRTLAEAIGYLCPPGPERSTAIAKVREAVMWANASIACGEPAQEPEALPQREPGKVTVNGDRGYRFDTAADVRGVITLVTRCLDCNDAASYDETQDLGWKWREGHARSTGHTGFRTFVTDFQR